MKIYSFIILFFVLGVLFSKERTFQLKSGNKVTGEVLSIDENGNYKVQTSVGEVSFNKSEVIPETVGITTKDGDKIVGVLTNEDDNTFYVKSNIGVLNIKKSNIENIDFNPNDNDWEFDLSKSDRRFYFGDEKLIDLWFDPTGNVLPEGTIYMSGLSAAYGLTDKFQISLRVWDYLFGNVNIRPKYQLFRSGSLEKTNSFSVGAHIYLTGSVPHKWKWEPEFCFDNPDNPDNPDNLHTDCLEEEGPWNWSPIRSDGSSYEIFMAYTSSKLKTTGRGRTNYNLGLSLTNIDGYSDIMQRIWFGFDTDVRKKLKLIGLIAYDEYQPTVKEFFSGEESTNIILDFGFVYAFNESFRIGGHFLSPFVAFYWKF